MSSTDAQVEAALKAFWKEPGMDDRNWMRAALAAAQAAEAEPLHPDEWPDRKRIHRQGFAAGIEAAISESLQFVDPEAVEIWERRLRALSPPTSAEKPAEETCSVCGWQRVSVRADRGAKRE